jgi:type VI protein secretion system component VasF
VSPSITRSRYEFSPETASHYVNALQERAHWLVGQLGEMPDSEFRALMRRLFEHWVEEFQNVERSLGDDT